MSGVRKILDAACGEGLIVKYLQDRQTDLQIDGFDISGNSITYAEEILPNNKFFVEDI